MIRKGLVLAAGGGTRLRPLTLAMPKEMVRVGTKPVIEHAIDVLKVGGIKDILVVVGRKKEAIMDYLGSGERLGVDICYKIQEEPTGTAHAVHLGKDFVQGETFAVIYGDDYLKPYNVARDVVRFHERKKADVTIVLHPVKDPQRFGIVKINSEGRVLGMVEKPTLKEAKPYRAGDGYLSVAGMLVLSPAIFKYIEKTKPGRGDEVWLTDSIRLMWKNGHKIYGYLFKGTRYEIGTFEALIEADKHEVGSASKRARLD
jgi:dTDP-glucose pyrophosphorylase